MYMCMRFYSSEIEKVLFCNMTNIINILLNRCNAVMSIDVHIWHCVSILSRDVPVHSNTHLSTSPYQISTSNI